MRRIACLLLLAFLVPAGCDSYAFNNERSSWASTDKYEFDSTIYRPVTITLQETYSKSTIWKKEIPPGDALVIDLDRKGENELVSISGNPATSVKWWLYGPDRGEPIAKGSKTLSGMPVRLVYNIRPAPEYPANYVPPNQATAAPITPPTTQP